MSAGLRGGRWRHAAARSSRYGSRLGFDAPTANSIDATSDRDFVLEFVNALTLLALHLSRWAEEMILFSYAGISDSSRLPEAYSTGSSAMPQKKNADLLELTRGKAARIIGNATALLVTVKGLPLAYNKDMQETQQPLFEAAETMLCTVAVGNWLDEGSGIQSRSHAGSCTVRIHECLGRSYLPRPSWRSFPPGARTDRQSGANMSRTKAVRLQDLPLEELRQLNPAFEQDFYSCFKFAGSADHPRCSRRNCSSTSAAGHRRGQEES